MARWHTRGMHCQSSPVRNSGAITYMNGYLYGSSVQESQTVWGAGTISQPIEEINHK